MCLEAAYGLESITGQYEQELWLGHSLPPELARRTTDSRNRWRNAELADLVDRVIPHDDISLAGFHRKLKEAIEFVSVFGEDHPHDFKKNLKDYLEESTTTQEK